MPKLHRSISLQGFRTPWMTSLATISSQPRRSSPFQQQQSNAERILSGRDTPSHDYDLIHQRIEVANFDWNATAFDGNVTPPSCPFVRGWTRSCWPWGGGSRCGT